MKRRALLGHLEAHGCQLLRKGGSHSWWVHSASNRRSAISRHKEINNHLAREISRDLGVPEPERF